MCIGRLTSDGFRRAGPPFGRRTDAVTRTPAKWKPYCIVASAKLDHSTVKHALQNTQNDCHQWLLDSSKSAPNSFSVGAPPRTPLGELTARFPRPPSCFKGTLLLKGRQGKKRTEEERGKGREMNWKGRGRPPLAIPGSAPDNFVLLYLKTKSEES